DFADQATIQVWMRPLSNLSNYQSYVESNNGGAYLSLESGAGADVGKISLWGGGSTTGNAFTANDVITVNQWTNFTAVYDGTQPVMTDRIRIYVNGVQQSLNFSGTVPTAIGDLNDFFLGAQNGTSQFANTQYDEVRLWDKALTPAEVAANWDQTIFGNEPGLIAYYAFEDGPGSPTATEIVSGVPAVLNNMDPNTAWVPGASGLNTGSGSGSILVTLTVTDEATNDASCEAIVTVQDVTPPTITCPANITVTNDPGVCTANVTVPTPLVGDNCLSNRALNFDGSNDFVDATATSNSSGVLPQGDAPRTMEAWIRTTQTSIGNIISWGRRSNNLRNGMAVRNNKLAFIGQNNDYTSTGVVINDNVWHHVAISYDGTTMNFYVDGALDYSVNTSNLNTTDQNLRLGRISAPDNGEYFNGDMDEVRIWDVALTQAQIQANMNNQLLGTESGLVAYFPMDEGTACSNNVGVTAVPDLTGNSNGTLTNFDLTGTLTDPCQSNWTDGAQALGGGIGSISLTNDFNNTDDASDIYPLGATPVIWTATDAAGNPAECTMTVTVQSPEILVEGNSVEITNGDNSPDPADDTDFGDQTVNSTTDHTFTIRNTGTTMLNLTGTPIVAISGASEFSVFTQPSGTSIAPNGSLTFVVRYAPTAAGSHTATISIDNDDCDENPYTFDVLGEVLCDISITSVTPTDEVCPGANDGTITVTATCGSCAGGNADIRYSISPDPNSVSPQASGFFDNLPDGAYTITVFDVNDNTCTDTDGPHTVAAGVDNTDPTPACNDITVQLDATGNYTLTQTDIDNIGTGSTDNCTTPANLTLAVSPNSFDCDDVESGTASTTVLKTEPGVGWTESTTTVNGGSTGTNWSGVSGTLPANSTYTVAPSISLGGYGALPRRIQDQFSQQRTLLSLYLYAELHQQCLFGCLCECR
ncbi:MAG: choice-of-anchor D domain-containing protein, partial [Saprospirales bacterium]|nr:choice-of-anchor D domain-containing protein [Saprospirales bacterium]